MRIPAGIVATSAIDARRLLPGSRIVLACLGAVAACVPQKPVITYNIAENRLEGVPPYIGTGDSLFLEVKNSVYADRYVGAASAEDVAQTTTPAVAGTIDVKRMADAFLPSQLLLATSDSPKSATAAASASAEALISAKLPKAAVPASGGGEKYSILGDVPMHSIARQRRALQDSANAAARAHAALVEAVRSACGPPLEAMESHILAKPAHAAVLHFLLDQDASILAHDLGTDSLPRQAARAVLALERSGRKSNSDKADTLLARDTLRALADAVPGYARRLQLLALHLPASATDAVPDSVFGNRLVALRDCESHHASQQDSVLHVRYDSARARLARLGETGPTGGGTQVEEWRNIKLLSAREVAGVDLSRFAAMSSADNDRIRDLYSNLALISQGSAQVVSVMNAIPRYTRFDTTERIPLGVFYTPSRVTVAIKRVERLGRYSIVPAISLTPEPATTKKEEAPAGSGGKASAEAKGGASKDTKTKAPSTATPAASAESTPTVADASAIPSTVTPGLRVPPRLAPDGNPMPSAKIDVLQRYRFRFSLGLTRSSLNAMTYEVRDSTLRVSGVAPTRLFPTAALSYALYPFNGQFLATQATTWPAWTDTTRSPAKAMLQRMGLWAQLGLSLNDPTKQVFLGLATDPLPGVTLGLGRHFGYVEEPNVAVDSRVPASQAPTRKIWRNATAATLTIDASVIISTFGALLGIK